MNKRIRELATEALIYAQEKCHGAPHDSFQKPRSEYMVEKFADLIIQECKENFVKVWYEQGLDIRGAELDKFLIRFEEHFGVE